MLVTSIARWALLVATFAGVSEAFLFQAGPTALARTSVPCKSVSSRAVLPLRILGPSRAVRALRMSSTAKQSPLEAGGQRGLDEEERRISLWRTRFELEQKQVDGLRRSFEEMVASSSSELRTVDKESMKRLLESVSNQLDLADISKEGRPAISEEELDNYINALKDLWQETCDQDAVEVANGECMVSLDTKNFDLSECVAIYGMCLRDHCGIGGVCFWDSA